MENNLTDKNTIVHDIRGQICPSCLLFTLREVNLQRKTLKKENTRIIIKTDNRDATSTIPDAVATMGYETTIEKKDGYYSIEIQAKPKNKLPIK